SAAINEVPDHMPNLSEVSVRRNGIAIRQHKSQEPVGICLERILQIRERHGCSIYLLRYVLKRKLRPPSVSCLSGSKTALQQPGDAFCLDGHATDPYLQKTQQSPGFGFNFAPH